MFTERTLRRGRPLPSGQTHTLEMVYFSIRQLEEFEVYFNLNDKKSMYKMTFSLIFKIFILLSS